MEEWLFTEPYEQIYSKRGDALGWLNIAESFSDMLAPGLSKRTCDARWITILSYCLMVSRRATLKKSLNSFETQHKRYEWLKPLELIWIAFSLSQLHQDSTKGLQLPGRRAVQQWLNKPMMEQKKDSKFGLSTDQWKRYRQTGIYGAYRVALRKLPKLTMNGDGWTPDRVGIDLAKLMESKLNGIELKNGQINGNSKPDTYWIKKVWKERDKINYSNLPTSSKKIKALPIKERRILKKAIFDENSECERRRIVAEIIGKVDPRKYSILCSHIAKGLKKTGDGVDLALLASFSQFADSAVDFFDEMMEIMYESDEDIGIKFEKLAENKNMIKRNNRVENAAINWCEKREKIKNDTNIDFSSVDELAKAISINNGDNKGIIRELINHHINCSTGRKWFNLINNEYLEPALPVSGFNFKSSYYRFRLSQLGRIAVQCGVIEEGKLPRILHKEAEVIEEEN